jgi:hypothetical protein
MFLRSLILLCLVVPSFALAKDLCPAPAADRDPTDMTEADFSPQRYKQAIEFLRNGFTEAIERHKSIAELESDLTVWIPYENSLRAIECYVLKQRALYEGGPAVKKFCDFIDASHWSD